MKKFFLTLLVLVIGLGTLYATSYSKAKNKAYASAVLLSAKGYNVKGLSGEYLNNGETKTYKAYLYSGNEYVIIGAGDDTVSDLDVQVYDRSWNLQVSDNDNESVSIVRFYPPHSGTYLIRTKMYSGHGYFFQMVGWK